MSDKQQQPGTPGPLLSAIKTQQRLDMCSSTIWRLEKEGLSRESSSSKKNTTRSIASSDSKGAPWPENLPARYADQLQKAKRKEPRRRPHDEPRVPRAPLGG